jgi:hypothetical protein
MGFCKIMFVVCMVGSFCSMAVEYPVVTRLRAEKLRVNSSALSNSKKAKILKDAGLNTVFTFSYILNGAPVKQKTASGDLVSDSHLPRLKVIRNEAKLAKKHKLISIPVIWFNKKTVPILQQSPYRKFVSVRGKQYKITPCPLDETYWNKFISPIICAIAKIQAEEKCDGGVALDQEFYSGDLIGGFCYGEGAQGCYCDKCFGDFIRKHEHNFDKSKFPLGNRYLYICQKYSRKQYFNYLEQKLAKQIKSIAAKARKIKPDLLLGQLCIGTWYLKGLAEGLSAPGLPTIILNEAEYFNGYNKKSKKSLAELKKAGFPYLYAGGLTISAYNARGLGAKAAELAQKTDGYWLYFGEMLFIKNAKIVKHGLRPTEYALREPACRYWPAIKKANNWLDKKEKLPELSKTKSESFLTEKIFPATTKVVPVKGGLKLLNPQKQLGGILINPDFSQPATKGWHLEGGITQINYDKTKNKKELILQLSPESLNKGALWQNCKVKRKQKYRFSAEFKIENVAAPRIGFQFIEPYSKNSYVTVLASNAADQWEFKKWSVSPYNALLGVKILVQGKSGRVFIKNPKLEAIYPIAISSNPVKITPNENLNNIELEIQRDVACELVDPETTLAYFKMESGTTDLRYLSAVYPNSPLKIRLSGEIDTAAKIIKISKAKMFFSRVMQKYD